MFKTAFFGPLLTTCVLSVLAPAALAAGDTTLLLRPHCATDTACESYTVLDPQTLTTAHFNVGETLDMDVVALNPAGAPVSTVKALLSYDPYYLEGTSIDVADLTVVAPGGADFSPADGLARIHVSAENETGITDDIIVVARVRFTVKQNGSAGTIVTFSDAAAEGESDILAKSGTLESSILSVSPGALQVDVTVVEEVVAAPTAETEVHEAASDACTTDADCPGSVCVNSACLPANAKRPAGSACTEDVQCEKDLCREGTCRETLLSVGETCTANTLCQTNLCHNNRCAQPCETSEQCAGNLCFQNVCLAAGATLPVGAACEGMSQCDSGLCLSNVCRDAADLSAQRLAFGLLSVQNLRITSDAQNVYLAWDAPMNPLIKGFNVYFGTKDGEYSRRRTVAVGSQSLVLRELTQDTRYFFAIRAVSADDEESPWSETVSVVVGQPNTSTAPLTASALNAPPNPLNNPDESLATPVVPGNTGLGSTYTLLLLAAAGIGILGAALRQSRSVRQA